MKKKIGTDLISIAHQILQLKNKSDINQLYETQNCMKLSVLRFIEDTLAKYSLQLEIALEQKINLFFDKSIASPKLNYQFAATVSEEIHEIPVKETNCRNK
jgi:hypothetical protein